MGLITSLVQSQYQQYPYPNYPLFYRPALREGWLSSSAFSRHLLNHFIRQNSEYSLLPADSHHGNSRVLVGGCGTIQPFIFSGWESRKNELHFTDLSSVSLFKAKIRLRLAGFRHHWHAQDLNQFLENARRIRFDHFDLYGVLHHLEDPQSCLSLIQARSANPSTIRLMIYNSIARSKIHLIQNLFSQMNLSFQCKGDISFGKKILTCLEQLPNLKDMFLSMRPVLKSAHGIVDTFFHQREIRKNPVDWIAMLKSFGVIPIGLYDRYGELDDMKNPLWIFPEQNDLMNRCLDRRFENNLELFAVGTGNFSRNISPTNINPVLFWSPYPISWFQFSETKKISVSNRMLLWHSFLRTLKGQKVPKAWRKKIRKLPEMALKRLARTGAILPSFFEEDRDMMNTLISPMCDFMEVPETVTLEAVPDALIHLIRKQQSGFSNKDASMRWQSIKRTLDDLSRCR